MILITVAMLIDSLSYVYLLDKVVKLDMGQCFCKVVSNYFFC